MLKLKASFFYLLLKNYIFLNYFTIRHASKTLFYTKGPPMEISFLPILYKYTN